MWVIYSMSTTQLRLRIFWVCPVFFFSFLFRVRLMIQVQHNWLLRYNRTHHRSWPKTHTAVSNANGFHWFCRQTSITGPSANKHMLVLNVSDPFFRERIMSHGHHFPHQNVTTILSWRVARKAFFHEHIQAIVRELGESGKMLASERTGVTRLFGFFFFFFLIQKK